MGIHANDMNRLHRQKKAKEQIHRNSRCKGGNKVSFCVHSLGTIWVIDIVHIENAGGCRDGDLAWGKLLCNITWQATQRNAGDIAGSELRHIKVWTLGLSWTGGNGYWYVSGVNGGWGGGVVPPVFLVCPSFSTPSTVLWSLYKHSTWPPLSVQGMSVSRLIQIFLKNKINIKLYFFVNKA